MHHRTIVIYFGGSGKLGYPLSDPAYFASYRSFSTFCHACKTRLAFARKGSYQGRMTFAGGWEFAGGDLVALPGPLTADVIYIKSSTFPRTVGPGEVVVNHPVFNADGSNKWLTYQAFPELMPLTQRINTQNWRDVAAAIRSETIVLKPVLGFGGKGIIIRRKDQFDFPSLELDGPYLAQAFVDSSEGIPGICTGYHDLRLILFDGAPKLALLRQPKPGQLLSNLAQGGTGTTISLSQVPTAILAAARRIDRQFVRYHHRIYTTDFFVASGRPYLIEINTQPGFPTIEDENYRDTFYQALYTVLSNAIAEAQRR